MVLQNGYITGSLFGPEWKQVQEWPQAGPSRLQGETEETEPVQDEDDEYEEVEEEVCLEFFNSTRLTFPRSMLRLTSGQMRIL